MADRPVNPWQLPLQALGRRRFVGGLVCGGLAGGLGTWLTMRSLAAKSPQVSKEDGVQPPEIDHSRFMRLAINQAKKVPHLPFGAVIVRASTGEVLADGYNQSLKDPTFHGEMVAINRCAAKHLFLDWGPLVLYTTAEPCPMCQSAIAWAGIGAVVYGSSIPFLKQLGWWQIDIRAEEVIRRTPFRQCALMGGVLEQECNELFLAVPHGPMHDQGK